MMRRQSVIIKKKKKGNEFLFAYKRESHNWTFSLLWLKRDAHPSIKAAYLCSFLKPSIFPRMEKQHENHQNRRCEDSTEPLHHVCSLHQLSPELTVVLKGFSLPESGFNAASGLWNLLTFLTIVSEALCIGMRERTFTAWLIYILLRDPLTQRISRQTKQSLW